MSKPIHLIGFVAAAGLVLAACGQAAPPPTAQVITKEVIKEVPKEVQVTKEVVKEVQVTKEVVKNVVKQTVVYNSNASDPKPREFDAKMVKMFMEKNPDINVVYSVVDHEGFKQAIRTYLTASQPPDMMTWFAGNRARFFIDKGLIADISDVWTKEGWDKDFGAGFKALSSVNGKQYFVPNNYYWWALYYRTDILAKNNVKPPATWDELLTACDTLKKAGITPIVTAGKGNAWPMAGIFDYINMRTNGPEFHINLMLGKEKYDDPRVKKTFENWKQLIDRGCFNKTATSIEWQDAATLMAKGEGAMYVMGDFLFDSLPKEVQPNVDFVQFPIIDPKIPVGEEAPTDGFFLAAKAPNLEAAKKFAAFMGSKDVQELASKELGRLPTNSKVDQAAFSARQKKGIAMLNKAAYVAQFYDRDTTPEMAEKGMAAFAKFFNNTNDIDGLLKSLEKDRALIFAEEQK